MSHESQCDTVAVSCSVFKKELSQLKDRFWPQLSLFFINSMLHMKPHKLCSCIDDTVTKQILKNRKVLLIYGDCCTRMNDVTQKAGVVRVHCLNCCDLIIGIDNYRKLSHEGVFFLFPEWAHQWKHVFKVGLGLSKVNATYLMSDIHKKIVYLDTGINPVPVQDLDNCSRYCGLPWEILCVDLNVLHNEIERGLDKIKCI